MIQTQINRAGGFFLESHIAVAEKALELARTQEQRVLAEQIETWLTKYRSVQAILPHSAAPEDPIP
jgi:hypothetical protein